MRLIPLPYSPDSEGLFSSLAPLPWSAWLDSGPPGCRSGRWDLLVCEPRITLVTRGPITEIREGEARTDSRADPLALVKRILGPPRPSHPRFPFIGGALGWLAYDLGRRFERMPESARDHLGLPEMAIGIYDWAILVDHARRCTHLVGWEGFSPRAQARLLDAVRTRRAPEPFAVRGARTSNLSDGAYRDRFRRVQTYIQAGDCYQVNLTRRFSVAARGDPWAAYLRLRRRNPAPFSAFLHTPGLRVLSASPERFLRVRGGQVESWPIKGTLPRDPDPEVDRQRRDQLLRSPKDRAENLMIVDLLRNDLGRVCALGTIRVPQLFRIQTLADVHHLVSGITGTLRADRHPLDLLRCAFPGGSVTGAPKIRAMEIIEELEGERRALYCGSIGYWGFDGTMDTNIVIRTLVHTGDALHYWAGGGIVADSSERAEAAELAAKIRAMEAVIASFRTPDPVPNGSDGRSRPGGG